jgi:excisionase family DNA binding protein
MADSREVMNIRQASDYLGVSPDTLYKYVGEEKIPAFKLGNRWRFKKSRLDQWMEEKSSQMEPGTGHKPKAAAKAAGSHAVGATKSVTKRRAHMFGMGSKTIVGLDVGSSSIKAVELKKKGGQIEVSHLGLEPLSSDIVVDSMIVDSGTVSSAISKLFADCLIKTKSVATAVSGHSVIVKKISLPSMSDQELAETIEKEAAQHIPFDLADVSLDYQILSEEAGSPQMDVLLVAVKKDKILNYTNVLSMAGRTPSIVDIDALALQNCYEYNYQPAPGAGGGAFEPGRQRDEHQHREGHDAVVPARRQRGRAPVYGFSAEGTRSELRRCREAEAGRESRDGERGRESADPATGDRDHRAGNPEDLRLLPGERRGRAHREDLPGGRFGQGAGIDGSVAAGISMPVELLNPFQRVVPPARRPWSGAGGAESGPTGSRGGLALRSFESL